MTDLRGVDLARFTFDHDLTFAALAASPDGRVYHRYGWRDSRDAGRWLTARSFERFLAAGLERHEAERQVEPPEPRPPLFLEAVPSFAKRDRGECIHCHSVNTSLYEEALEGGGPPRDWIWRHPDPQRVGLDLDRDEQTRVTAVVEGSAAARAGLRVGDELLSIDDVHLATASDLMYALDGASAEAVELVVRFRRGGRVELARLALEGGWKAGTPLDLAWRPLKWAMTPAPGFGGAPLTSAEKRTLELPDEHFAFRVDYLVTWGDNRRYGEAAAEAGLAVGDVVVAVDGQREFASIDHFHAWWRLTVDFGETVRIETLREGRPRTLELTALR